MKTSYCWNVLNMDNVVKYNPEFPKWIEKRPWYVTPDFDGKIEYYVDAYIIGIRNIDFYTTQTGA